MRNWTKFSFLVLAWVLIATTACEKGPSAKIYNTWSLEDVNMQDADSLTLAKLESKGITYTFFKDGKYTASGAIVEEGTFKINDEGTNLSITEGSNTARYDLQLTESTLRLSSGEQSMTFIVKK